jgi:hypothetical protein
LLPIRRTNRKKITLFFQRLPPHVCGQGAR